jgi:RNA polymerase primary sigma factor
MIKQKFPKSFKDLLQQGEDDGFVVQDDIFLVCAEPEKHIEQIDEFFDLALKKGVDIYETISTREEEEVHKSAEEVEKELEHLIGVKHGESLDPIKKYLKEIARRRFSYLRMKSNLQKHTKKGMRTRRKNLYARICALWFRSQKNTWAEGFRFLTLSRKATKA